MTAIRKLLADGNMAEFDSEQDSPEAIERYVTHYNSTVPKAGEPQVPNDSVPAPPRTIDADTSNFDSLGTKIDKTVRTGVRALGSGIAQTGDLLATAGRSALDTAKAYAAPFMSEKPEYSEGGFISPVSDLYNANVVPIEEGYEDLHSAGEIILPAFVGNLGGSMVRLPIQMAGRKAKQSAIGTAIKELAVKPAVRTATDIGLGHAGGEIGGSVVKGLGGSEALGNMLGSALLTGAAGPATKYTASKVASGPKSKATLSAIENINRMLPPGAQQIPPTLGLVGNKGMGLLEDLTGRGTLSGKPALEARRQQYEGLEEGMKEAAARVRSSQGGPRDATGPISDLTIGRENVFMGQKAQKIIKDRVSAIENQLVADAGKSTPVTSGDLFDEMESIVLDPDVDAEIKDHARAVMKRFARNVKVTQPKSGVGPPHVEPPTFGGVSGFRSRLGQALHKGQPLDTGTSKRAYAATTREMKEAAEGRGVTDFDIRQAETKRLSDQQRAVKPTAEATTAKGAYESVFGGPRRSDVEQFTPYTEHTPETLAPIMANALELKLRGGSAGLPTNPESLDLNNVIKNWKYADEEFKLAYTGGDPDTRTLLDNIANVSEAELVRPGKRTTPGKSGNTMGATAELMRPAAYGGLIGAGGGFGVDNSLGALAGVLAGATLTPAAAYAATRGLGGMLTDPRIARGIVNPTYSKAGIAQHAAGGAAADAAWREQERKEEAMRKRGG